MDRYVLLNSLQGSILFVELNLKDVNMAENSPNKKLTTAAL
jgi:hypothetical protein